MKIFAYSLKQSLFEGEADVVSLPAENGEISILKNHLPLITSLKEGKIKIKKGGGFDEEIHFIDVQKGFAQINPQEVIILVD